MKPLIATPCYGGVLCLNYVSSIIRLKTACAQIGMDIGFYFRSGESLITRARNDCVAHFLDDKEYTHLFWIDADVGFEPAAAIRLINAGYEIAAGVYPMKGDKAGFACDVLGLNVDSDGFAKVKEVPTGFMCIRRDVFTRLAGANPDLTYLTPEGRMQYRFFDTMIDPETKGYLSEDYAFCRLWSRIGGEIYLDAMSDLTHQGTKVYTGALRRD